MKHRFLGLVALIVDHGARKGSEAEAERTKSRVQRLGILRSLPNMYHLLLIVARDLRRRSKVGLA